MNGKMSNGQRAACVLVLETILATPYVVVARAVVCKAVSPSSPSEERLWEALMFLCTIGCATGVYEDYELHVRVTPAGERQLAAWKLGA